MIPIRASWHRIQGWLKHRPVLRRVLGNASWLVADKIIRLGVAVIITALMARQLGASDFGLLNFSQALVWMFSTVAALGLESVVILELVRRPEMRQQILASAFAMRVGAALVGITLCVATVIALRPRDDMAWKLALVLAPSLLFQATDVIDYQHQSAVNSKPIVIVRNAVFVCVALIRLALLFAGASLIALAATFTLEAFLTAVLFLYLARDGQAAFRWSYATVSECRRLLRQSAPLVAASLSIAIYMRIDQIMLGQLGGDAAVGVFSAAVKISESWYFIPMSLVASTAPILAASFHRSEQEYRDRLTKLGRVILRLSLLVAICFTVFAPWLIRVIYGDAYRVSATVLAIHGWNGVFVCMGVLGSNWLLNAGLTRWSMYQTLAGAVANVLMNVVLIPQYGAVGAAVSTLVGYFVAGCLAHLCAPATRPIFFMQMRLLR